MKRFFIVVVSVLCMMSSLTITSLTAQATSEPTITKEEAIEILSEERINVPYGRGDDGTTFPEMSFLKYQIEKWVNENYDNGELCWYYEDEKMTEYSLNKKYGDYYKYMTSDWDFDDDENGNWTIKTPDNFYTFEFVNGMWNQIDKDGNVVDMFPPVSTLDEDSTTTQTNNIDTENASSGNRVTGTTPDETTTVAEETAGDTDSSPTTVYFIIGGAVVGLGIGAGVFFLSQKKKG